MQTKLDGFPWDLLTAYQRELVMMLPETRDNLMAELYDHDQTVYLTSHISRIRSRLRGSGWTISNTFGGKLYYVVKEAHPINGT